MEAYTWICVYLSSPWFHVWVLGKRGGALKLNSKGRFTRILGYNGLGSKMKIFFPPDRASLLLYQTNKQTTTKNQNQMNKKNPQQTKALFSSSTPPETIESFLMMSCIHTSLPKHIPFTPSFFPSQSCLFQSFCC